MGAEELAADDSWPQVPMIKAQLNNHMRHIINILYQKEGPQFQKEKIKSTMPH